MCGKLFSFDIRSWTPRLESCALECVSTSGGRCYYLPQGLQPTIQSLLVSGICYVHNSLVVMGPCRQNWRKLRHKWLYTYADFNTPNKCSSLLQRQINYHLLFKHENILIITHVIDRTFQIKNKNLFFFVRFLRVIAADFKLCPSGLTKLWRPSVGPLRSTSRGAREVTAMHHS